MTSIKQHERTFARSQALQVMYQSEVLSIPTKELIETNQLVEENKVLDKYALRLLEGVSDKQALLDEKIDSASENWALDRMPLVDKSLLRLAAFEMIYIDEVPVSVSINEAVNLAKDFGGEDSPRFVNGILGRIALLIEGSDNA